MFCMRNIMVIWPAFLLLGNCSPKTISSKTNAITNTTIKVMSYNIHHANPPSVANKIDIDAVAAVIKNENPDLVGLQEVDKGTKRSGNIDEAALLAQKTGMQYRFFKAIDHDGGEYGLAILSRFPIETFSKTDLPQVMKGEPRILSYITVQLPGNKTLLFANTHLDAQRADSNRVVQVQKIIGELSNKNTPVIIVGDFNSEANRETINILDQHFQRSCSGNCAFTIPETNPNRTIDFIALKNASWRVTEHKVIPEQYASDHRPVVAVYEVK
jgi:endonuclease/exonuclease/phosphatase family metal-dependent hydrolase